MGLSRKIFWFVAIIGILPMLLMAVYPYTVAEHSMQERLQGDLKTHQYAHQIWLTQELANARISAYSILASSAVQSSLHLRDEEFLSRVRNQAAEKGFTGIAYLTFSGEPFAVDGTMAEHGRDFLPAIVKSVQSYGGTEQIIPLGGLLRTVVAVPVGSSLQPSGILVLCRNEHDRIKSSLVSAEGETVDLYHVSGNSVGRIFSSDPAAKPQTEYVSLQHFPIPVKTMQAGERQFAFIRLHGGTAATAYSLFADGSLLLAVSLPEEIYLLPVEQLRLFTLLLAVALTLLLCGFAWGVGKYYGDTMRDIAGSADKIVAGELYHQITEIPDDEIGMTALKVRELAQLVRTANEEKLIAQDGFRQCDAARAFESGMNNALFTISRWGIFLFCQRDNTYYLENVNPAGLRLISMERDIAMSIPRTIGILGGEATHAITAALEENLQVVNCRVLTHGRGAIPATVYLSRLQGGAHVYLLLQVIDTQLEDDQKRNIQNAFSIVYESGNAVIILDKKGIITFWNRGAENMTGYRRNDVTGRHISGVVLPGDTVTMLHDPDEKQLPKEQFEMEMVTAGGVRLRHSFQAIPLWGQTGAFEGIALISRGEGATGAHQESASRKRLLEGIVDTAPAIIIRLDDDGKILLFNAFAETATGYRAEEVVGRNWFSIFISPADQVTVRKMFRATIENNRPSGEFENDILCRDGTRKTFVWRNSPEADENGTVIGMISVGLDISGVRNTHAELAKKSEQLHSLNEALEKRIAEEMEKRRLDEHSLMQQSKLAALGDMIGAIAHQWRQPLNTLGLLVQDIREAYDLGELDTGYLHDSVDRAMEQIKGMSHIIDDFRSFYQQEKEALRFDVIRTLQEALSLVDAQMQNNDITVTCPAPGSRQGNFTIIGHQNDFKQVILSLVANARDAILDKRGRSGSLRGVIDLDAKLEGNSIVVTVEDNGGGIPHAVIGRIFEPYFTTKPEGKGTGVGLYMAKMIVERSMKGSLKAENGLLGAVLTLEIPRNQG